MNRKWLLRSTLMSAVAIAAFPLPACTQTPMPAARPQLTAAANIPTPTPAPDFIRTERVTLQQGDTLYSIARKHDVTVRELIAVNHLVPPYIIYPGTSLRLPPKQQAIAYIRKGEVRPDVFKGTNPQPIIAVEKQALPIPTPTPAPVPAPAPQAAIAPAMIAPMAKPAVPTNFAASTPAKTTASNHFIWPVQEGNIISRFGPKTGGKYNDGINIAAPEGTQVRAVADGTVVYADDALQGYGNLVIIRHDNGFLTAYAHKEDITVKKGDRVQQGQIIGHVGETGNVTSPQLHFGIRKGTKAVNPEQYLTTRLTAL